MQKQFSVRRKTESEAEDLKKEMAFIEQKAKMECYKFNAYIEQTSKTLQQFKMDFEVIAAGNGNQAGNIKQMKEQLVNIEKQLKKTKSNQTALSNRSGLFR